MGIDLLEVQHFGPDLAPMLLFSVVYAILLIFMAQRTGGRFFWMGIALGVLGFLLVVRSVEGPSLPFGNVPHAFASAWFACRSILRRQQQNSVLPWSLMGIARTVGGFWGGIVLLTLVHLLLVFVQTVRPT